MNFENWFEYLQSTDGIIRVVIVVAVFFGVLCLASSTKSSFNESLLTGRFFSSNKLFDFENLKRGVFVSASSGSGKTESIIVPIIKQIVLKDHASIIYDFKFDDDKSTKSLSDVLYSESLKKNSQIQNFYFNIDDPTRSHRCNPLKVIPDSSFASSIAETLLLNISPHNIKNPDFWYLNARALVGATIWFLYKKHPEICTLPHVIEFIINPAPLDLKIELIMTDLEAAKLIAPVRGGLSSSNQSAGAQSSPQADLAAYASPSVYWCLTGAEYLLDVNNSQNPKRIVLGNNAVKDKFNTPLLAVLFAASIQSCSKHGRRKTVNVIDEGSTIFIPQLARNAATLRDYDIATVFCAQDISQVQMLLNGETQANALLSNLNTQFYGKSNVPSSAAMAERKFSPVKVKVTTRSSSKSGNNSSSGVSESYQDKPALTSHQLAGFKEGQFAVHSPRLGEFKTQLKQSSPSQFKVPVLTFIGRGDIERNFIKVTSEINQLFFDEGK